LASNRRHVYDQFFQTIFHFQKEKEVKGKRRGEKGKMTKGREGGGGKGKEDKKREGKGRNFVQL